MESQTRELRLIAVAVTIAVAMSAAWTCTARTAPEDNVLRYTLDNGLRVVIVRNRLAPVVTTEVNYLVGSNEAPAGFPGMAHAQEHMMFRGSPDLSEAQLSNLIAAMGGRFDADTQETVTQYYFTVPARDVDVALHIASIRMRGVLDSEELWEKERGAIEQEVAQDMSSPLFVFYERLLAGMFAGTPYAHSPLGTTASFQATTGAMLESFYDRWYTPNNAILVIVGDVNPVATLSRVEEVFGDIPPKILPERPKVELGELEPATIRMETDYPYGLAILAYRLPGYRDPDYAAGQVLADVLGSERGDLYGMVADGRALLFDFETSIFPHAGMGLAVAGFPRGGDGDSLIATMKSIIADYVENGLPADLVAAAKRREVTDAELEKNSIPGLASQWSQALALQGLQSPAENTEAIERVTPADVDRVARAYLVNETATIGILTPAPAGRPMQHASPPGPRGKESFAPAAATSVPLPEWAEKAVALPSEPESTLFPADMTLANGLRLIVQPTTISRTVEIQGEVKHQADLATPKGQEGVDDVLESLFSYGTTTLDRLAFRSAVDSIGATLSVGASFSLAVLDTHFDRGVELLADNLLAPALPDSAFEIVKAETASMVAGQLESPDYRFRHALHADIYPPDDPTLRQPTPESVSSLTPADVRDYYRKVFRPDLTTIVVIGNITPEEARTTIGRHFEGWKAVGEKPATDLPPVPLNGPATTVVPDPSRVQDMVVLAQTLGLTRSNPAYYTLQVGNHVLSGAFYATRLYRDLRAKTGIVYMVESALDVKKTRGAFEVIYACEPSNVPVARGIIEQDLRQMQNSPITPEELRQAQTILVRGIPLSESSTTKIANQLLEYAVEGLPLDESVRAGRRYLTTTAPEVMEAFARWIRPGDLVQVSLGPPPR